MSTLRKTAIPCSCVGTCSVVVVVDFEAHGDDEREVFVEFFESYNSGIWGRARAAWRVLRGKDPWLHAVCLDHDGLEQLRQALGPRPSVNTYTATSVLTSSTGSERMVF